MKVIIMAGGKGTRVAEINSEIPKPMLPIAGKPVLAHQIDCLRRQGFDDITLVIGHLGHVIKDYFNDSVKYIEEYEPLGTAGALFFLKAVIDNDFLLINGDIIFDIDIKRFIQAHKTHGGLATIFTHPNNHPYDSSIVIADTAGKVTKWLTKEDERTWYKNRVNAGLHILSHKLLERFTEAKKRDLDRDILKPLILENALYIYDSPEYVKDMGTPRRIKETERDLLAGIVSDKNLANKQKALFIDRDGTINKYVGFLRHIDDFELNDEAIEIMKKANCEGRMVIVVTNQPVIARGEVTWEQLSEIHNKMETLLGQHGVYVDDIFICPHHPDKGFVGEREEYKIECECRKPKPGMLLQAAAKYNIDLSQSIMIGDSKNDMLAGKAAGCATVII